MSYDQVSLLIPMDGANNGTVFTDWSVSPKTISVISVLTKTDQHKFYGSSGYWNGAGSSIDAQSGSSSKKYRDSSFYIGAWVRASSLASLFSLWVAKQNTTGTYNSPSTTQFAVYVTTAGAIGFFRATGASSSAGVVSSDSLISVDTWIHCACSWDGTTIRVFLDGTVVASSTDWHDYTIDTSSEWRLYLGGWYNGSNYNNQNLTGWMQDVEEVFGDAVYTSNFTAPARRVGTISNAAVGAAKILDSAGDFAARIVHAIPRSSPTRAFSTTSNASGEFEIRAPVYECSVVALADEVDVYNDLVARVIPV